MEIRWHGEGELVGDEVALGGGIVWVWERDEVVWGGDEVVWGGDEVVWGGDEVVWGRGIRRG